MSTAFKKPIVKNVKVKKLASTDQYRLSKPTDRQNGLAVELLNKCGSDRRLKNGITMLNAYETWDAIVTIEEQTVVIEFFDHDGESRGEVRHMPYMISKALAVQVRMRTNDESHIDQQANMAAILDYCLSVVCN